MTIDDGFEFNGRVVLVACGSTALGSAVSRYLSARGAVVIAHHEDATKAGMLASDLAEAGAADARVLTGSTATPDACREIITSVALRHGRLDAIVNGLGTGVDPAGPAPENIELGLSRTILLTQAAVPEITRCREGRIVHVTSGIGVFGLARHPVQSAVDAGILGYSNAVALELAHSGAAVNAVAPIMDGPAARALFDDNPTIPADRYTPDAVAPPIAYLCHPRCTLNGVVLTAAAGRVAKVFASTSIGHMLAGSDLAEIDGNIDQILAPEHSVMPRSVQDELLLLEV